MKRFIAFLAAFALVFAGALSSCSPGGDHGSPTDAESSSGGGKPPAEEDLSGYANLTFAPKYDEVNTGAYTDVYFDADGGNDENDGFSETSPKKSVEELNRVIGTQSKKGALQIFLKGTFKGTVEVSGYSSSEKTPLMLSSYGEKQAVIDGNGNENAVYVSGGNVRVKNLEITNPKGLRGIYVFTKGHNENIVISGCYIHNVNWNWVKPDGEESYLAKLGELGKNGVKEVDEAFVYERGGIVFNTDSGTVPCWLENVWVENNRIEKVSRSGVFMTSNWVKKIGVAWGVNPYCDDEHGYYPSKNVNYVGNRTDITGGDGLVMIGVKGGYFERNVSYNANYLGRSGTANVGMWPISSSDIVMQFNEAAFCRLANGAADGEGFDIDIGCRNVTFRYNYSHDNDGGGILLCNTGGQVALCDEEGNVRKDENGKIVTMKGKADWNGAYIRNNVFARNGKTEGNYPALIQVAGPCDNVYLENNTVIFSDKSSQPLMTVTKWDSEYDSSSPNGFYFKNNIFYSPVKNNGYIRFTDMGEDYLFLSNVYYNMSANFAEIAADSKAFGFDPAFDLSGDFDGYEKITRFAPAEEKCYVGALAIKGRNLIDAAGNITAGLRYFGAIAVKPE